MRSGTKGYAFRVRAMEPRAAEDPVGTSHLQRYASIDDEGRLLATAKEYRFDVRADGREGWMCGIGAVFTPPDRRGRGHASALVEEMFSARNGTARCSPRCFQRSALDVL